MPGWRKTSTDLRQVRASSMRSPSPIPIVWSPPSRPSGAGTTPSPPARPTRRRGASTPRGGVGPNRSRRSSRRRHWVWVTTSPTSGFVVHVGSPRHRCPTTSRSAIAGARARRGGGDAAGVGYRRPHLGVPPPRSPTRKNGNAARRPAQRHRADVDVALEAETGLRRTKIELMLKQLAVDGAADRSTAGWFRHRSSWRYDAQCTTRGPGGAAARGRPSCAPMSGRALLMQLLTASLDDPLTQPCGRCSVCLAGATEWTASVDDETVRTVTRCAARRLDGAGTAEDVAGRRLRSPGTDPAR